MLLKKFNYIIIMLIIAFNPDEINCSKRKKCEQKRERHKRYLVHYQGGLFKMVCAIGIPIKLGLKQSLSVAWNLQYQYTLSANASLVLKPYPPIVSKSLVTREISDREVTYLGIEAALERYGLSGRNCLLRSICENAMNTVGEDHNGLFGKLLHILLTPNHNGYSTKMSSIYLDAQKAGQYGVDCYSLYPHCLIGNVIDQLLFGYPSN